MPPPDPDRGYPLLGPDTIKTARGCVASRCPVNSVPEFVGCGLPRGPWAADRLWAASGVIDLDVALSLLAC